MQAWSCHQTSPKRWFGNVNTTSFYDVMNSAHLVTMTTTRHWWCVGIQASTADLIIFYHLSVLITDFVLCVLTTLVSDVHETEQSRGRTCNFIAQWFQHVWKTLLILSWNTVMHQLLTNQPNALHSLIDWLHWLIYCFIRLKQLCPTQLA